MEISIGFRRGTFAGFMHTQRMGDIWRVPFGNLKGPYRVKPTSIATVWVLGIAPWGTLMVMLYFVYSYSVPQLSTVNSAIGSRKSTEFANFEPIVCLGLDGTVVT